MKAKAALPEIVARLRASGSDDDAKASAAHALANIILDATRRASVAEAGALPPLVALLQTMAVRPIISLPPSVGGLAEWR